MGTIKVKHEEAVALFVELGINSAARWNNKRLAVKLAKVSQMVDEETALKTDGSTALLDMITQANKAGTAIEVIGGDGQEAETAEIVDKTDTSPEESVTVLEKQQDTAQGSTQADAPCAEPIEPEKVEQEKPEGPQPPTKAELKDAKAAKWAKLVKKTPKAVAEPGEEEIPSCWKEEVEDATVEPATEPEDDKFIVSGRIIAKHGIHVGITDAMVQEFKGQSKAGLITDADALLGLWYARKAVYGYLQGEGK